ncbi:uncharacterized protein LOC134233089 isoform X3 [Saccostrea cucullata]|uniref:uncharacterized protein LOC134233089 isoform X3 n=1 Tax=Saccostrea cuccullata TaxID=36930 RepID=UPI002ECFFE4E
MNLQMYIIFSLTFFYHIGAVKGGCNPDHENNCCQGFFFEKISNECKGHNLKSPKTANELQENKSSESRKGNEDWKTASHGQLTPILIGIIAFLTFLLFAIGGRMIWKKVQQSNPKIVQRTLEIQSLDRKLNKTKENEEAKENFYEDIDGLKAGESSKDILSSENDYIDKLDFVEKEKSDNRESNHFYDALK